jgi:dipeptidase E
LKLLLTSNGLTNPSIATALEGMLDSPPSETMIAYILTAANAADHNGGMLLKDFNLLRSFAYKFDFIDPAGMSQSLWQPRLESAQVLYFAGGNPYHLLDRLRTTGLADILPKLLEQRVYVGFSAGSAVVGKDLAYSSPKSYRPEGMAEGTSIPALGFVDYCVKAHLGSPNYPHITEASMKEKFAKHHLPLYAIDDNTALKIVDDSLEIVSEGDAYLKLFP